MTAAINPICNSLIPDNCSALRKTSEKVLHDNMAEILTCRHCGRDAFPPLLTRSFNVHELKEVLRDGFLPSSFTMKCIEQEIPSLEAMIKEVNDMLEDARAALNPVIEYLAVARSVSSPIRRLPGELLSNIFSYLTLSCFDKLRDAMFEAGILGSRGSTIHRLASVCKYWWHVVRDTPVLHPTAYISYHDKDVLAVRQYIEMTAPHPLKFHLHGCFPLRSHMSTQLMEKFNYRTIVQELLRASSRWQTADLECMNGSGLESAFDVKTKALVVASIYHSSYPLLKELCLRAFPMSQFFSQEQVPALRVLKMHACQIELHAMQPILPQITSLDLRFFSDIDANLDFHAILSYAPALSQLTVFSAEFNFESYMSRIQSDTRSPVLLSHLRRLHVESSIFMLDIITAPNLVHFLLGDVALYVNVVDTFLRRSRCSIKSLDLDIESPSMALSIVDSEFWCQMPHVTHLAVPAGQEIWAPFEERTPDGRFSVFPQLQHLEIDDDKDTCTPRFRVVSDMMRVVLKRCGARKIRVEGHTGCPLTQLQYRTLLALSECGALDVTPKGHAYSDDDSEADSDGEEEDSNDGDDTEDSRGGDGEEDSRGGDDEEDSHGGDDDGVAYI
ncbi:hypothetical protein FISHEDRAFT_70382 [Fistulina hepatica ATCC 64428]|uniref:Uncharacterized protein n=1 Tax=Fistulina hepatica ATCC 64428 TaxID=1128425 RepID=A0A0D7AJ46_9AGAR|nr:hypothetical protein FISHEDRAFT_70382 [Fistulina hepatica ATCC 64428]